MRKPQWLRPDFRVWIVAAALVGVGTAGWFPAPGTEAIPTTNQLRLVEPADDTTGPVEIVDVEGLATWGQRDAPPVRVEVHNSQERTVRARIWWLLAGAGDARPWVDPVQAGERRTIALGPDETRVVVLPAAAEVPTGAWAMSLWAHTVEPGSRTRPSHGVGVTPLVHILPTRPDVYRLTEPGQHAVLSVLEPVGRLASRLVSPQGPDALASVTTTTSQPVNVQLRCYLAVPGTQEPWTMRRSFASEISAVVLEPGSPRSVGCRFADLPSRGTWELSAFLRLEGATGATHEDGLYSRRPVTFGAHESSSR